MIKSFNLHHSATIRSAKSNRLFVQTRSNTSSARKHPYGVTSSLRQRSP
jgi:hypothetical protein